EQQRTVNYYQNLSNGIPKDLFQSLNDFDCYFRVTSMDILTEYLALSVKKIPHEAYIDSVQKLIDDCVSLEKKGAKFNALLLGSTLPSRSQDLTLEDLAGLYGFFCQR